MPLSAVFKLFFVPQELQKVKMPTYTAADAERRRADVRRSFREVAVSMPEEREELWQLPADAPEALKALRGTYYLNGYWVAMLAFQTRSLTNVSVLSCCSKFPHKKSRFILELVYSYSCIVKLIWWKLLVCVHFPFFGIFWASLYARPCKLWSGRTFGTSLWSAWFHPLFPVPWWWPQPYAHSLDAFFWIHWWWVLFFSMLLQAVRVAVLRLHHLSRAFCGNTMFFHGESSRTSFVQRTSGPRIPHSKMSQAFSGW